MQTGFPESFSLYIVLSSSDHQIVQTIFKIERVSSTIFAFVMRVYVLVRNAATVFSESLLQKSIIGNDLVRQ